MIIKGNIEDIIELERKVKETFFNEDYFKLYNSTEIFSISIKQEILDFINSNNLQRLS